MVDYFTAQNFEQYCQLLAGQFPVFEAVRQQYGYPPMWQRPNSFESILRIILEQQVSLASARTAYEKLKAILPEVTATAFLELNDDELRQSYFSKQKIRYSRLLAQEIVDGQLILENLPLLHTEEIMGRLTQIVGIGEWTASIYCIICCQKINLLPLGDVALVNSMKNLFQLPASSDKADLLNQVQQFTQYKTIAAYWLWWHYIQQKKLAFY
ncbi:MAG: DNA-3-methyladenine glycosylase 2 family protein [Bacteroidetes bacterium]|nr:MAG: DNA-3-methyladenine glycosylase 2 family protein [Bacteroidota bacterium]